jgi:nitrogen fixation/metabolism regulation signal transduction histidine kinase
VEQDDAGKGLIFVHDIIEKPMIRFETKLLLVFAVFFTVIVALVVWVDVRTERRLVREVEEDLKNIVNTVHFSTQKLSAEHGRDRAALEDFIEAAKRNEAIREISVIGSTREVIASSNPQKVGEHHELSGQEIVLRERFGGKSSNKNQIQYEIKVPLIRNDKVIGLVQTSIVVENYRHLLRQLVMKNILIAGAVMLFAVGAVFFVLNRINRPLRQLIGASEKVAVGDLTVRLASPNQDEVGRLTSSFNSMTVKLAEQQQLENKLHVLERRAILAEMASNLAHEIRNPLNLINLTADHLSRQFLPEGEERRLAYEDLIAGLKSEVRHLNRLVHDFLEIGKPARPRKSTFAWDDLFDQVQRSVKHQVASKGIMLEFVRENGPQIKADPEQMRLVFLNLILNAIEAVSENGKIVIRVEAKNPEVTLISFVDNGPGVADEDLERIFEPYFSRRRDGTGLGLALVKRIVEEHSGRVRAVRQSGGARFEIVLPTEG